MFASVIQGHTRDADGLRRQSDRWMDDLSAGAEGWLGTTQGVTDEGIYVAIARFESQELAIASNNRPELGAWFMETAKLFDGDLTFYDCPEVDTFLGGGSDDARFVQLIEGTADRDAFMAAAPELEAFLRGTRPDIMGGLIAWHGDGQFSEFVYFTDEAAARVGEAGQMPGAEAEIPPGLVGWMQPTRFLDLRSPWFLSPGGRG